MRRKIAETPGTWSFAVLVVICLAFVIARPNGFGSSQNLLNIVNDAAVLLILAVGQTYVIITAGVDLSVGGVLVFGTVVATTTMRHLGADSWTDSLAGMGVAVLAGLLWGLLNGFLVAYARVPALIVTLGTLGMSLGASLIMTSGLNQRDVPTGLIIKFGIGKFAGIPWPVLTAALVTLLGGVWLAFTRFGRYTYAIGSNPEAARRAGVNVRRHLVTVYAMTGLLAGFGGFISLARFGTTSLDGHSTDNLQTIAAVVIGGTSLFGGIGTIFGTVIGVFIPAVLQNGFIIAGVQPFWQQVVVGAVLILAVYVDQLRRRARSAGRT